MPDSHQALRSKDGQVRTNICRTVSITPVKRLDSAKSRLDILTPRQRSYLTLSMLRLTIDKIMRCRLISEAIVVTSDPGVGTTASRHGAKVLYEEADSGVNIAVSEATNLCLSQKADSSIVIPSDLPLLTTDDLERIIALGSESRCAVISPSICLNGTNILYRSPPDCITTHYEHDSFWGHFMEAVRLAVPARIYLSPGVLLDLDTRDDLMRLMQYPGEGEIKGYLATLSLETHANNCRYMASRVEPFSENVKRGYRWQFKDG